MTMKRLILIALAALLLAGLGTATWILTDLPSVRLVWQYGFSYGPEPTGRKKVVQEVEFIEIGPGCFLMGSKENTENGDLLGRWRDRLGLRRTYQANPQLDDREPSDEIPTRWVGFRDGFWIAKRELTNKQYEAFDPEHERIEYSLQDKDPVVDVSWEDAKKYCAWLSERSGLAIRLPSESEWECACRAGSRREFCFGDDEKLLSQYAWYDENSGGNAHEVGTRQASTWGLYDMHGNVWEWCEDTYHENHENAPRDGTAWTEGGLEWEVGTPVRVMRGGGPDLPADCCRSAARGRNHPGESMWDLGFRLAFSSRDH